MIGFLITAETQSKEIRFNYPLCLEDGINAFEGESRL